MNKARTRDHGFALCPHCEGRGYRDRYLCRDCNGLGWFEARSVLQIPHVKTMTAWTALFLMRVVHAWLGAAIRKTEDWISHGY